MNQSSMVLYVSSMTQFILAFISSALGLDSAFFLFFGSGIACMIGAEISSAISRSKLIIVEEVEKDE